jgi:hypothetical protein
MPTGLRWVIVGELTLTPTLARAECAWVLWQEAWFAAGEHEWSPLIGSESSGACVTVFRRRSRRPGSPVSGSP